jgi:hypothetical protein
VLIVCAGQQKPRNGAGGHGHYELLKRTRQSPYRNLQSGMGGVNSVAALYKEIAH